MGKYFGVRTLVTYALVGATIAAGFIQLPPEQTKTIHELTIMAMTFFFVKGQMGGNSSGGADA